MNLEEHVSPYEHLGPNQWEKDEARDQIQALDEARHAFREAHRAFAQAIHDISPALLDRYCPKLRGPMETEETIEGFAEQADGQGDLIIDGEVLAQIQATAESEDE